MIDQKQFNALKHGEVIIGQGESEWKVIRNMPVIDGNKGERQLWLVGPSGQEFTARMVIGLIYQLPNYAEIWALNGDCVRIKGTAVTVSA